SPCLQLRVEPAQARAVDDAQVERLFQRLAGSVFTDGVVCRQKAIQKAAILFVFDNKDDSSHGRPLRRQSEAIIAARNLSDASDDDQVGNPNHGTSEREWF